MRAAVARPASLTVPGYRPAVVVVTVVALAAGFLVAGADSTDLELTHLLRMMAALKLAFVAVAAAFTWWRLGHSAQPATAAAYLAALAAASVGPGLIWGMAHVVLGAALLHGGLVAAVLIAWRDNGTRTALAKLIPRRNAALPVTPAAPANRA